MALAQAREIDAILVTELSSWGRSTQDLVQTLDDIHGCRVSVLAQTGLSFDLGIASGKLMRTIRASQLPRPGASRLDGRSASVPPTRRPSGCSPCTGRGSGAWPGRLPIMTVVLRRIEGDAPTGVR